MGDGLLSKQGGLVVFLDDPVQISIQVAEGLPGQDELIPGSAVPDQLQSVFKVLANFLQMARAEVPDPRPA